ncbi:MAG: nucleotidyltransferase substrate binding protein [Cellvibrionales bacterium]|nr:nucleotidyltransferase substrate binding protein [Cellvibrionales bacterium]
MNAAAEPRWQQRFANFENAYRKLAEIAGQDLSNYSLLEREGFIQRFEYTHELAWNTLKDWLLMQGYQDKTPREVIQRSFAVDILPEQDTEHFLASLKERNLTSHTYNEQLAQDILQRIQEIYQPMFGRLCERLQKEADKK